jgi:hypothetical protein
MQDAKGRPIQEGDIVYLPCRITFVAPGADDGPVSVVTAMSNDDGVPTLIGQTITGSQLVRANPGDDVSFQVP